MKKLLFIICMFTVAAASAQQWGLYTLYSPKGTNKAYLVDTNGVIFKTWTFPIDKKTCFSSYLTRGDTLVRTVIYQGMIITGGPISGETQKVDWNNNVDWDFIYSDSNHVTHHDICPMPNGNVLLIAIDVKTPAEALQAGSSVTGERYSEKILEVHPTGPATGNIVWEWDLWDHLCQHYDATKDNYVTSLVQNPQLICLNYRTGQDFMHLNGIDYNAALDQITFSSLKYNEIYVIDHSTTTAQAHGHTGGNSGKGGDLIYRWGNAAAYGVADANNFDAVHDAHWVPADDPYFPNYLCGFNNSGGTGGNSCVDIFCPPYNGYNYNINLGSAYTPATYTSRYNSTMWTQNEGSSQQLPNGNTLICMSFRDTIFEINHAGTILWSMDAGGAVSTAYRYSKCFVRGPVATAGASATEIVSGAAVTLNSSAASVTEASPVYTYSWTSVPAGFASTAQNPLLTPDSIRRYFVTITDTTVGCSDTASVLVRVDTLTGISEFKNNDAQLVVYPNPTTGIVNISGEFLNDQNNVFIVHDPYGKTIKMTENNSTLNFSGFAKGVYFLTVKSGQTYKVICQ